MNFLQTIVDATKESLAKRKALLSEADLYRKVKPPFAHPEFLALLVQPGLHLIAEIKRASPSKGDLRPGLNPADIAALYKQAGIKLVSILTEEKFFKGNLEDLVRVRQATGLSLLRKDFIIDTYQMYEAKLYGADAVLLIAAILEPEAIRRLCNCASDLRLDVVVEVHNESDIEKIRAVEKSISIIGINNRNLEDFTVDLSTTERLLPLIPKRKLVVSESGIENVAHIRALKKLKINAVLIGEALMKSDDVERTVQEFLQATH